MSMASASKRPWLSWALVKHEGPTWRSRVFWRKRKNDRAAVLPTKTKYDKHGQHVFEVERLVISRMAMFESAVL